MSDVFRQQVSDQSTDDVRPQRRQIIVSGLPLKSWRSWQWGQTAYVVTTSIPFPPRVGRRTDRKSTRLNSSHGYISYAVFCLKKKKKKKQTVITQKTDNDTRTQRKYSNASRTTRNTV